MKLKNIILRALTMLSSSLMILPLVLSWVTMTSKGNIGGSETTKTSLFYISDFTKDALDASKNGAMMSVALVFLYITFALAMALILLEVLRFFVKENKIVEMITKVVLVAVMLFGILTLIFSTVWCVNNNSSNSLGSLSASITYTPWFGGIGTLVFSLLAGIVGLLDVMSKSKSKKK